MQCQQRVLPVPSNNNCCTRYVSLETCRGRRARRAVWQLKRNACAASPKFHQNTRANHQREMHIHAQTEASSIPKGQLQRKAHLLFLPSSRSLLKSWRHHALFWLFWCHLFLVSALAFGSPFSRSGKMICDSLPSVLPALDCFVRCSTVSRLLMCNCGDQTWIWRSHSLVVPTRPPAREQRRV
jgi:hypothetical protein